MSTKWNLLVGLLCVFAGFVNLWYGYPGIAIFCGVVGVWNLALYKEAS